MSEHEEEWPEGLTEGESIELGPDNRLQESAVEWIGGGTLALGAAKVSVDMARVRLDRDRLDLDRERLDFDREQAAREVDSLDSEG